MKELNKEAQKLEVQRLIIKKIEEICPLGMKFDIENNQYEFKIPGQLESRFIYRQSNDCLSIISKDNMRSKLLVLKLFSNRDDFEKFLNNEKIIFENEYVTISRFIEDNKKTLKVVDMFETATNVRNYYIQNNLDFRYHEMVTDPNEFEKLILVFDPQYLDQALNEVIN